MESMFSHVRYKRAVLFLSLFLFLLARAHAVNALEDFDGDGISDNDEDRLAHMYLPTLQFVRGELFFPTSIEYHLDNSILKQKVGNTIITVNNSPTISDIAVLKNVEDNYFLDNKLTSWADIADDYHLWQDTHGYFIYAHIKPETTISANYMVVQYWLFYPFNNGPLNDHQGDWEMIEIILDATEEPLYAVYSQHHGGEQTSWANVEKTGETHPKVYVAKGSHANYFRSYQGNLGLESDIVAASGDLLNWNDTEVTTILLGEKGTDKPETGWMDFAGRWGALGGAEQELRGRNGPLGPVYNDEGKKWQIPASWGLNLFEVDNKWFTMNWIVANFLLIFFIVIAVLAVWKVYGIIRLHRKEGLKVGKILKTRASIGIILGIIGIALSIFALFLPWYMVTANIQTGVFSTEGDVDVLLVDGVRGVQVNLFEENEGLVQFFGMAIPFFILILATVMLGFLDLVGMKSAKQMGRKYITSGILTLIPVLVIILFIFQLAALISYFAFSMGGGQVTNELATISDHLSSQPLQGSYSGNIGEYGVMQLSWGLGIGSYLLIAAAVVKLAGGIVSRTTGAGADRTAK